MTARPVVAVESEKQPDLEKTLGEFGKPVFLFKWRERPRAFDTEQILEKSSAALKRISFDPATDMVVLTGQLVYVTMLVSAVLAEYGRANLLVFDAVHERYVARSVRAPNKQQATGG